MTEPWRLGVAALDAEYAGGRLDPVAVLDCCLDRIARLDPQLNSIVALDAAGARHAAQLSAGRRAEGAPLSPLDGVPFTIKDNLLVRGLPATWGSRAYADYVPDHDEQPVARLRAAGAVIVGKTNVPELTLEGYTSNLLFGTTRNPWDPRRTPGGSSGGAAAGVAAGLVPAAIGTDGGGSIRRPASHTGLVGFKPSRDRMARADGFPALLHDFEVVGALARSVADVALIDRVFAGRDHAVADDAKLRILYVPRFGDAPIDPEVLAATDAAAARLSDAGHIVAAAPVFFDRALVDDIWRVIGRAGVASLFAGPVGPRLASAAGPSVRAMAAEGAGLCAADYVQALARVEAFRRSIAEVFVSVDLVFTPTAAALPWPAEDAFPTQIDGRAVGPRGHAIYTGWVNVAGNPAVALPLGWSAAGLPIGGQFVAAVGTDDALLAAVTRVESTLGVPTRWPALASPDGA